MPYKVCRNVLYEGGEDCVLWRCWWGSVFCGVLGGLCSMEFWGGCALWSFGATVFNRVLGRLCSMEFWGGCVLWSFKATVFHGVLGGLCIMEFWGGCVPWSFGATVLDEGVQDVLYGSGEVCDLRRGHSALL